VTAAAQELGPPTTQLTETAEHARDALDPAAKQHLHIALTPGVWLARVGGDVTFGPLPAADELNIEDDFDLDELDAAVNFEMAITKGDRWQINASGFDFSANSDGTFAQDGAFGPIAFSAGDAFESSFDMTSVAVDVSYWQWHPINSAKTGGRNDLWFSYGGGLRWLDMEHHLELTATPGTTAEGGGEWIVPCLVMQMDLRCDLPESFPILDGFEVLGSGSIGPAIGGDGGAVVSLAASLRGWIFRNFSVDFGYRLIQADVENDDYEFSGGLQGLFLSGTLRF
jgi:hypothetical protein